MMDGNEPLRGDELLRKVGEDDGWIKRLERTPFERDLDGFTIWRADAADRLPTEEMTVRYAVVQRLWELSDRLGETQSEPRGRWLMRFGACAR